VVRIGLTQPRVRLVRVVAPELFVIDGLDLLTVLSTPLACTRRAVLSAPDALVGYSLVSPSKNPRGVDVRFDFRSGSIEAQQLMSLLNVVTLSDQHPDGAIQDR
jgi:hypothetical protein